MKVEIIYIKARECQNDTIKIMGIPESYIAKKISGILHFTSQELRPSFDTLISSNCSNLTCLINYAEKKFRDDIASWIVARIETLQQFIHDDVVEIPSCLEDFDELIRRLTVGLLYAIRSKIKAVVVLDDVLSLITNERYGDAWVAMMRPFVIATNTYLETKEMLRFNPVVITPGGHGGSYRLARPGKYVIIFDHNNWEVPFNDIEKLANS